MRRLESKEDYLEKILQLSKEKKGLPTGECACCANSKKGNNLLKQYN